MNQPSQKMEAATRAILPALSPPSMNAEITNSIVSWSEIILSQRNTQIWNSESVIVSRFCDFSAERIAHPPLGARADMDHGVDVVISGRHGNRTAPSGWMMRLVVPWFLGEELRKELSTP
jgi:hypothetical protein